MKSGKRIALGSLVLAAAALLHAEMQEWVQHLPGGDWLTVFFRQDYRRPPAETRPALTQLITGSPKESALYRLRAQEAELQLDFVAAEADWRRYVQLSSDAGPAWLELADYFDRRHQPAAEVDALRIAGRAGSIAAFGRALQVIADQALPDSSVVAIYRAWLLRSPQDASVRQHFIAFLASRNLRAAAEEQLAAYRKAFPKDAVYPVKAAAGLAADPLTIYEREFQPLWPDELTKSYLSSLEEASQLRAMVARSRVRLEQDPDNFREAGRLFLYWRQQNNLVAARRVLAEYKLSKSSRKAPWKPDELYSVARLFEKLPDVAEAAELYVALYSLPGADAYYAEQSLSGLANLLLTNPEQPIRYGSSDLSFYKDIATLDRSPGFLNGILSLVLNGTGPRWEYARQNTESTAYFHRAAAAELVDLLDRRFPQSGSRAVLHAQLVQAYNAYGDDETVIRSGRAYLAAFPREGGRVDVALTVADALARRKREREEFALYDQMLAELGRASGGGSSSSPTYVRVLERYLARLAAAHQPLDAIRLYRREIDRNPNDPGLYERLAAFLTQANMAAETEAVYRQAIAKFNDRGWYEKLARWYLRRQQTAEVGNLTHQLVGIFSGTELERYFAGIVSPKNLGATISRQMNLYAHERFPEDLVFVRNLLAVYSTEGTRDEAAYLRLLRQYWSYDPQLRDRFFQTLSGSGKLDQELAAARSLGDPAGAQFLAEGEAWRSHFEIAAPAWKAVADAFPGDRTLTTRASSIYRSLATLDDRNTSTAVALARRESQADPRDREAIARIGDIYAEHNRLAAARPFWDAMPATAPGNVDAWRDAATVFWDYYLYDDALRVIGTARTRKDDDSLLAFEAGAIYEGKRQEERAVTEYINGYLAGDNQSESRILRLARRPALQATVDRLTSEAAGQADAEWPAISLRLAILREQRRTPEVGRLLLAKVAATRSPDLLRKIGEAAGTELPEVRERAIERQIAVTQDPVEQARLRIDLVRFFESQKDLSAAARTMDALYQERPQILGVVRATVDFYTRNQRPADAIRILTASASHANDTYRDRFTVEAARLATGAHSFNQAREFLQPLMHREPYNSEYLAATADTYLQAGDDRGFRDFQVATIQAFRGSSLAPADRIARIAAMRRRLIPALDRLADRQGAVDQYVEVINSYPEDESLIREASLYAARHSLGGRLTGFYAKTIVDAPRDYRWPMVLARVETALEDFPAAIAAYDSALKGRPDRKDLLSEREALEERLMDFERAIATCRTLYDLSYHDPQWMRRSASLKARLGRRDEAVRDLRSALIGEAKETPEVLIIAMRQLDQWNYTAEAASYGERAARMATSTKAPNNTWDLASWNVATWVRAMVRGRKFDAVLAEAATQPNILDLSGPPVREFYTPEEKAAVETAVRNAPETTLKYSFSTSAEFMQLQSELLNQQLMSGKAEPSTEQTLIALETRRGRFPELARTLESLAQRNAGNPQVANRALADAANAWRAEGDRAAELRVLTTLFDRGGLNGQLQDRYFILLDPAQRSRIVDLARTRNPAVTFAVHSGDFVFARQAVTSRASAISPLWSNAYTALAGVYHDVRTPEVDSAFRASLGGGTIGERVRHRADPKQQITGNVWFYYGARYGEYLDRSRAAHAKDYLPSAVEATPGNPEAYFELGDFYRQSGQANQAVVEYQHVLQLDADRGDAENAIARTLWHENRRDEAIQHWRAALAAFERVENRGVRVPESFWIGVTGTLAEIGAAKQITTLQPDVEKLLREYANINGAYRTYELLSSAIHACFDSDVDYDWVLTIGAENEWLSDELLRSLNSEFHLTPEQQESVARRLVDNALSHGSGALAQRIAYIDLLIEHGKASEAQRAWEALPASDRQAVESRRTELRLFAVNGQIAKLLDRYRANPSTAPRYDEMLSVAGFLGWKAHPGAVKAILEYVYQTQLDSENLSAANFLGLAGVYLESGETERAVKVLRRMTLISGEEFETFVPAATLLTEHGKTAEAIPFLRDRLRAVPWDSDARLQLARLLSGEQRQSMLSQVVQNADAPYAVRASAARMMGNPSADGSTELGLLQRGQISPAEARKPFYVEALKSAGLYREALAMLPSDEGIRLEALRAALAASQDSLAIALLQGLNQLGSTEPERAIVARDISLAYERSGDLAGAIRYTQRAIVSGMDLTGRKTQLETEQRRQAENARRAPTIRDTLEQDHVVKPRVGRAL